MPVCPLCGSLVESDTPICSDCLALSYSSCQSLAQCPRQWQLQHTESVPKATTPALLYGLALHSLLECDGYARMVDRKVSVAQLGEQFDDCLDQVRREQDPYQLVRSQVEALRQRGRGDIAVYHQQIAPTYRPVAVEMPFLVPLMPAADGSGLKGIIDAVTAPQQKRIILDFKTTTSSKNWTPDAVAQHRQATAYLLAEQALHPAGPAQRVTYLVFVTTTTNHTVLIRPTTRTTQQRDAYQDTVRQSVQTVRQYRQHGTFPAQPGPQCGRCLVYGVCESGQRWLTAQGRRPTIPVVS